MTPSSSDCTIPPFVCLASPAIRREAQIRLIAKFPVQSTIRTVAAGTVARTDGLVDKHGYVIFAWVLDGGAKDIVRARAPSLLVWPPMYSGPDSSDLFAGDFQRRLHSRGAGTGCRIVSSEGLVCSHTRGRRRGQARARPQQSRRSGFLLGVPGRGRQVDSLVGLPGAGGSVLSLARAKLATPPSLPAHTLLYES